ncbi:MAG: hypothetical protein Q7S53_01980 [bacterium]|nr:hypothetical protein [bacterium]
MEKFSEQINEYQTCLFCGSNLVYPVERTQLNENGWKVAVRCPNCFGFRVECMHRDVMVGLIRNANKGREDLAKTFNQMAKKTMEEESDKMISALHRDQILPIDF